MAQVVINCTLVKGEEDIFRLIVTRDGRKLCPGLFFPLLYKINIFRIVQSVVDVDKDDVEIEDYTE